MSLLALFGTFETGLVYALVALGVLLSFRVLDFPDLTADGSFPLGAFACAVAMTAGIHPVLAIGIGFAAGAAAGVLTAWLHVKLGILQLLAGIIVMTALYSINLRIGDAPNVSLLGQKTIFDLFTPVLGSGMWQNAAVLLLITLLIKFQHRNRLGHACPRRQSAYGARAGHFHQFHGGAGHGVFQRLNRDGGGFVRPSGGRRGRERGLGHDCVRLGGGDFGRGLAAQQKNVGDYAVGGHRFDCVPPVHYGGDGQRNPVRLGIENPRFEFNHIGFGGVRDDVA